MNLMFSSGLNWHVNIYVNICIIKAFASWAVTQSLGNCKWQKSQQMGEIVESIEIRATCWDLRASTHSKRLWAGIELIIRHIWEVRVLCFPLRSFQLSRSFPNKFLNFLLPFPEMREKLMIRHKEKLNSNCYCQFHETIKIVNGLKNEYLHRESMKC